MAICASSPDLVKLLLDNGAVTDWYDAYESAKLFCLTDPYARTPTSRHFTDDIPMGDADRVLQLIEEHKEEPAVPVGVFCTTGSG